MIGPILYVMSWLVEFAILGTLALGIGLVCLSIAAIRRRLVPPADRILIADFNNDETTDRAVFRNGEWIFDYGMDGSINLRDHYGQAGDIPLAGRNAGGITNRAVFRSGEWIIDIGMDGTVNVRDHFGQAGDIPLVGDFNNDGIADRAVFRPTAWENWIIDYRMDGTVNARDHYGSATDIPVIGDFNGDKGKARTRKTMRASIEQFLPWFGHRRYHSMEHPR